jgi:hypothetical protein
MTTAKPERPIRTQHVFPPIPIRRYDWSACRDGNEEGGPYGWGRTKEDAIADLLETERERREM